MNVIYLYIDRPLLAGDSTDQPIKTNSSQAVIWAIGPVNSKAKQYNRAY